MPDYPHPTARHTWRHLLPIALLGLAPFSGAATAQPPFVGPTVAGVLIVVALTMNMYDMKTMIYAAVIGFVAALPVAWIVAGKINDA